MSFTPGAPLRRSFKEDREERTRKKSTRHRVRIAALLVVLVLVGAGAWVAYARPDFSARLADTRFIRFNPDGARQRKRRGEDRAWDAADPVSSDV